MLSESPGDPSFFPIHKSSLSCSQSSQPLSFCHEQRGHIPRCMDTSPLPGNPAPFLSEPDSLSRATASRKSSLTAVVSHPLYPYTPDCTDHAIQGASSMCVYIRVRVCVRMCVSAHHHTRLLLSQAAGCQGRDPAPIPPGDLVWQTLLSEVSGQKHAASACHSGPAHQSAPPTSAFSKGGLLLCLCPS